MEIKNIIFDLGGILLELYPQRTINELEKLGIYRKIGEKAHSYSDEVFENFETGKISASDFKTEIKNMTRGSVGEELLVDAWNAMICQFPQKHVDLLRRLRDKGYKLFLLSNTNELHVKAFEDLFYNKFNFHIRSLFDRALYSNEIGRRKPHKETFQFVLQALNIAPDKTLMIDDSPANIEGAKASGMCTLYIETNGDIFVPISKIINF
ncbi:MAG: HAD family hydrolase [Bacteroidales bacterium]